MSAKAILLVIKAAFIQTVSANTSKTILTIVLISLVVVGGTEKYSRADKPVSIVPSTTLLLLQDSRLQLSGTWTGSAGFGQLSFFVNSSSTGITEITYGFREFRCGSVVRNGGIRVSVTTPWPIIDNQFIIENTLDPNFEVTLNGTFNQTGTNVSGNWEAVSYGMTCTGTWNASPVQ